MSESTTLDARADAPEAGREVVRDDLFVLIHKALRYGLLKITTDVGSADWGDPACIEALLGRWETIERLIRSHAGHEDRYIFALLATKQSDVVEERGIGHAAVELELDEVSEAMHRAFDTADPSAGLAAYRALTHFVATAMAHFSAEEPEVMERIWETCTDEEVAACRAAFMAEIAPEEAVATYELMFPAIAPDELTRLLGAARAAVPEPVFASLIGVAERTLEPPAMQRLRAQLEG